MVVHFDARCSFAQEQDMLCLYDDEGNAELLTAPFQGRASEKDGACVTDN